MLFPKGPFYLDFLPPLFQNNPKRIPYSDSTCFCTRVDVAGCHQQKEDPRRPRVEAELRRLERVLLDTHLPHVSFLLPLLSGKSLAPLDLNSLKVFLVILLDYHLTLCVWKATLMSFMNAACAIS